MSRKIKVLICVLAVFLVLVLVAGFFAGNYFYDLALNPHADKSRVFDDPENQLDFDEEVEQLYNEERVWFDQSGYTSFWLRSRDELDLHAFAILQPEEEQSDNWVIINHGYSSASWEMVTFARQFYERGYNVLLPDARGHGHSQGEYIGMGWHDRLDLIDWAEGLNRQFSPRNIVLFGVSMGGGTVMMASGEELPENVCAIIEDCGYTSAWDEFAYQAENLFGIPSFPVLNFTSAVARIRAGYWIGEADAVKQVAKSTTPILFIHGDADTFVPSYMLDEVYEAANCEKEKLLVPGAEHGGASVTDEVLYWSTVEEFLARYLV